jgi:hypothetical protein
MALGFFFFDVFDERQYAFYSSIREIPLALYRYPILLKGRSLRWSNTIVEVVRKLRSSPRE